MANPVVSEHTFNLRPRVSNAPRFGTLTASLAYLENNPLTELVVKDVLGFNTPKIALARTSKERLDVATLELSNTAITLSSSLLLPRLLKYPVSWISKMPMANLVGEAGKNIGAQAKLGRLAVSSGFLFPFAGAFWAAAFFRNYVTLKRNKTASFEDIIGASGASEGQPKRSLEEEKKHQLGMAKKVFSISAALGAASLIGFSLLAKNATGKTIAKPLEHLFNKYRLMGAGANQVNGGMATFLFWLMPAYVGWIHAARGKNESREQAVKVANGILWFSAFTPMLKKFYYLKQFQQAAPQLKLTAVPSYNQIFKLKGPLQATLKALKDRQELVGLGVTILMLATTPQLLNIAMTKFFTRQKENAKPQPVLSQAEASAKILNTSLPVAQAQPNAFAFMARHPMAYQNQLMYNPMATMQFNAAPAQHSFLTKAHFNKKRYH